MTTAAIVTQARALYVLGIAAYHPRRFRALPPLHLAAAQATFDSIVEDAVRRGFRQQRNLMTAIRSGRATTAGLQKAEAVASLFTPDELRAAFERCDAISRGHDVPPAYLPEQPLHGAGDFAASIAAHITSAA